MAQHEIPLPLEVQLRLHIAMLQRDLAQVQAQLLKTTAEQQFTVQMTTLLQLARITPSVPLSQCALDLDRGVLHYEGPDEAVLNGEMPSLN